MPYPYTYAPIPCVSSLRPAVPELAEGQGPRFDRTRWVSLSKPPSLSLRKTFFAFFAKNLDKIFPVRYGVCYELEP
jgi:hypothetical protein